MKPFLSILIPTKDRYITLIPVIKGLIRDFKTLNVEFVIQDNTKNSKEIEDVLDELKDDRIKYFHNSSSMPITKNCDLAIKNSKAEYLIMIGDDDYVLPTIMESVQWMRENEIDCLNSKTATYYWSNLSFKYQTSISNTSSLILDMPFLKKYTLLNPINELTKVIKSGGVDFANLPRLYHGIVKRTVLNSIFDQCKTYFPGPSPDMANSSALAIFTKKFYFYNAPLSISGKSKLSTSGMGLKHTHVGDLDDKPFLDKNLLQQWNKKVPYFWSGDTIYAQSLSHSLRECSYNAKINYNKLYAHLLVFERRSLRNNMKPILESVKSNPINFFIILYGYFTFSIKRGINYLMRRFFSAKNYKTFTNVVNIEDCCEIIDSCNN